MTEFETLAAEMDRIVDDTLGDTIRYRRAGGVWVEITGFILDINDSYLGDAGLDEMAQARRIKISMGVIDKPQPSDRIMAAKLGNDIWRPSARFDVAGRYWIADLQKTTG